ncbi:MAG: DUF169 domain-containing protein [Deltaproteobacteria bacterium]|jgi:hypothetical protein|nr:DUF169 domain-containing protein [Deltaproteobacteria bacterium]
MESEIAKRIGLRYPALGLYRSAEGLHGAKSMAGRASLRGCFGCSMVLVARSFAEGMAVSFSAGTVRCPGAAHGFAVGTPPFEFPGGFMGSARLLSCGNSRFEEGRAAMEELRAGGASREVLDEFGNGEGFKKDPETVMAMYSRIPRLPESPYVILRPLSEMDWPPEVVLMLADCGQLSALTILANYARQDLDAVRMPFAAACMSVCAFPLAELSSPAPRAVVGLTDVSGRVTMKRLVGRDLLSFAMPWPLYVEMEANAEESFLNRPPWRSIA